MRSEWWNRAFFSAKQAWQHPFFRWSAILAVVLVLSGSSYFLWKVLPARHQSQSFVSHYNVYLGIDQVRPWIWAWLLPGFWFMMTLLDLILAYILYRTDFYLAVSLLILACAWSLPWIGALFYLSRVNV